MANDSIYEFSTIEPRWQAFWEENKTFKAVDFDAKPKYYALDMLPYPSGSGLHIGHPEGYTATDILSRYKKATGHNVLHPMGWDAFGLPAEQHAIATGTPPAQNTEANVNTFRRQLKALGFAIDWDREISTTDPDFYRWTQWIFLQLFKHGLAYVDEKPVWWCPALGTVLANEEIVDGKSERGNHPVERHKLRQWVLRITAYADKLLNGLKDLDWPDSTKRQQKSWIGRSQGCDLILDIDGHEDSIHAYTTRPDTIFGIRFIALAPEHPLVEKITTPEQKAAVDAYIDQAKSKSDLARTDLAKDKSGVPTGAFAINPLSGERIPIWTADYVLMSYGTGAVIGVPGHDARDNEFAHKYELEIPQVIKHQSDDTEDGSKTKMPLLEHGTLINSGAYSGMHSKESIPVIIADLEKQAHAKATVNYKLRDWLFSRQRYWGEPFPILWVSKEDYEKAQALPQSPFNTFLPKEPVFFEKSGERFYALPLPEKSLPLTLPHVESYQPSETGESPLANAEDWVNVAVNLETGETLPQSSMPDDGSWACATRETNTMPQWAGSCWYYLRYLDPKGENAAVNPKIQEYWGTPDYYIGGAEHAVLHLLYARFWHHFLFDIGFVKEPEPFKRLFHQGIILGEDGTKMSKSGGNTVDPEDIIKDYGADALRLYEMFLGPLEDMKPWNTKGIEGIARFLRKIWREYVGSEGKMNPKIVDAKESNEATLRLLHETIKKVEEGIEGLRLNTAISQMMVLINQIQKAETVSRETAKSFLSLLAPFAPHIAEELWVRMGETPSVAHAPWPTWDASYLQQTQTKIVVQVNGKMRAEILMDLDASKDDILETAKAHERVTSHIEGKTLIKEIYVPGKIVNLVAK